MIGEFILHNFEELSEIEQARIQKKKDRLLNDHIYGTRRDPKIDKWLGRDASWLVELWWSCESEHLERLKAQCSHEGIVDWDLLEEILSSGEVEGAFQEYRDPGDLSDMILASFHYTPHFPLQRSIRLLEDPK